MDWERPQMWTSIIPVHPRRLPIPVHPRPSPITSFAPPLTTYYASPPIRFPYARLVPFPSATPVRSPPAHPLLLSFPEPLLIFRSWSRLPCPPFPPCVAPGHTPLRAFMSSAPCRWCRLCRRSWCAVCHRADSRRAQIPGSNAGAREVARGGRRRGAWPQWSAGSVPKRRLGGKNRRRVPTAIPLCPHCMAVPIGPFYFVASVTAPPRRIVEALHAPVRPPTGLRSAVPGPPRSRRVRGWTRRGRAGLRASRKYGLRKTQTTRATLLPFLIRASSLIAAPPRVISHAGGPGAADQNRHPPRVSFPALFLPSPSFPTPPRSLPPGVPLIPRHRFLPCPSPSRVVNGGMSCGWLSWPVVSMAERAGRGVGEKAGEDRHGTTGSRG